MKLAIIQIRGAVGMSRTTIDTLNMLKLVKKNSCVVIEDTRANLGMLVSLKDYVTWGKIDEATFRMLLEKRGRIVGNKSLTEDYLKEKTKFGFDEFVKNFFNGKIKLKEVPAVVAVHNSQVVEPLGIFYDSKNIQGNCFYLLFQILNFCNFLSTMTAPSLFPLTTCIQWQKEFRRFP